MSVLLRKIPVDGKRPGDTFTRQGTSYRVVRVYRTGHDVDAFMTESNHGREVWL